MSKKYIETKLNQYLSFLLYIYKVKRRQSSPIFDCTDSMCFLVSQFLVENCILVRCILYACWPCDACRPDYLLTRDDASDDSSARGLTALSKSYA